MSSEKSVYKEVGLSKQDSMARSWHIEGRKPLIPSLNSIHKRLQRKGYKPKMPCVKCYGRGVILPGWRNRGKICSC